MKIFKKLRDGGPESNSYGFWLIEWKSVLSIGLLRFEGPSREAYHTHAFNALSWVLKGTLREKVRIGTDITRRYTYDPSLKPIYTTRSREHQINTDGPAWALTFRGPWVDRWKEWLPKENRYIGLTHGRREIEEIEE